MRTASQSPLTPRKFPRQDRSIATVDAIFEATIQVLEADGLVHLNTTRVARRAGVSVGTLYQYFPNKQSLLFAILERHIELLTAAIEKACERNCHASVELIADAVVEAYLHIQMVRAELSPNLYRIAMDLDAHELLDRATVRCAEAIEAALSTASDSRLKNLGLLAQTLTAALYGTVPVFCHRVLSFDHGQEAEKQLKIMFRSYLAAQQNIKSNPESAETNSVVFQSE